MAVGDRVASGVLEALASSLSNTEPPGGSSG